MFETIISMQGHKWTPKLNPWTGTWEYRRADVAERDFLSVSAVARVRGLARKLGLRKAMQAVA